MRETWRQQRRWARGGGSGGGRCTSRSSLWGVHFDHKIPKLEKEKGVALAYGIWDANRRRLTANRRQLTATRPRANAFHCTGHCTGWTVFGGEKKPQPLSPQSPQSKMTCIGHN